MAPTAEFCSETVTSQDYADFIFGSFSPTEVTCEAVLNFRQRIGYIPLERAEAEGILAWGYGAVPKLFSVMDAAALERSGITRVQNQTYLQLRGQGVLIGIVDTGINYQNPQFRDASGRLRIAGIWDQTQPGTGPADLLSVEFQNEPGAFGFGREYTTEELSAAFTGEPLTRDASGHGTRLALLAAGNSNAEGFAGAAPESELLVVKLKPAKDYLKQFWRVDAEAEVFQENDIMLGLRYLIGRADQLNKPLVILLGVGSNQGSHTGSGNLAQYVSSLGEFEGVAAVVAAGNEAGRQLHFYGQLEDAPGEMELLVSQDDTDFSLELWSRPQERFTLEIRTPTGETLQRLPLILGQENVVRFSLIPTTLSVFYQVAAERLSRQLALLRFEHAVQGIWLIRIIRESPQLQVDAWLPLTGSTRGEVRFLTSNPDTTVTEPGNASGVITIGAYDIVSDVVYLFSGRGYSGDGTVKPDLVAPGVDVLVPRAFAVPGERLNTQVTGTSYAAAITAGAAALLLEWGIVQGRQPTMNTALVKGMLIRGARVRSDVLVPDRSWGYGALDLYQSFARTGLMGENEFF